MQNELIPVLNNGTGSGGNQAKPTSTQGQGAQSGSGASGAGGNNSEGDQRDSGKEDFMFEITKFFKKLFLLNFIIIRNKTEYEIDVTLTYTFPINHTITQNGNLKAGVAGATLEVAGGREVAQNTANASPENKASINPMEVKLLHLHKDVSGADAEIVNHQKPHEYWGKKHLFLNMKNTVYLISLRLHRKKSILITRPKNIPCM